MSFSVRLLDADAPEERQGQFDHFGVQRGVVGAERLDAQLLVLPVAALLAALVAEVGRDVVQLGERALRVQAVLDIGAQDGGGAFGAQGQRAVALGR